MNEDGKNEHPRLDFLWAYTGCADYFRICASSMDFSRVSRICPRAFCHTAVSTVFLRSLPTKNRFRSLGAHHGLFLIEEKCGTRIKFSMPKRALVGRNSEICILEMRRLPYDLMVVKSTSVFDGIFRAHFKSCSVDRRANSGSLMWTKATNGAA